MKILFTNLLEYAFHSQIDSEKFKDSILNSCQNSVKELNKCDEKLDELYTILREDASYYERNCQIRLYIILGCSLFLFLVFCLKVLRDIFFSVFS